jgi:hypothetical protein
MSFLCCSPCTHAAQGLGERCGGVVEAAVAQRRAAVDQPGGRHDVVGLCEQEDQQRAVAGRTEFHRPSVDGDLERTEHAVLDAHMGTLGASGLRCVPHALEEIRDCVREARALPGERGPATPHILGRACRPEGGAADAGA